MYLTIAAGDFYLEQDTYLMKIYLGTLDSYEQAATFAIDLNSLIFGYEIQTNFS